VLAESAAPYSLSIIVFTILRGVSNSSYRWFEGVMMAMSVSLRVCRAVAYSDVYTHAIRQFLSQAWIILRISMGTTSIRTDSTKADTNNQTAFTSGPLFVRSTFTRSDGDNSVAHKGQLGDDIPLDTKI
jgi:hypothetical protein